MTSQDVVFLFIISYLYQAINARTIPMFPAEAIQSNLFRGAPPLNVRLKGSRGRWTPAT